MGCLLEYKNDRKLARHSNKPFLAFLHSPKNKWNLWLYYRDYSHLCWGKNGHDITYAPLSFLDRLSMGSKDEFQLMLLSMLWKDLSMHPIKFSKNLYSCVLLSFSSRLLLHNAFYYLGPTNKLILVLFFGTCWNLVGRLRLLYLLICIQLNRLKITAFISGTRLHWGQVLGSQS